MLRMYVCIIYYFICKNPDNLRTTVFSAPGTPDMVLTWLIYLNYDKTFLSKTQSNKRVPLCLPERELTGKKRIR